MDYYDLVIIGSGPSGLALAQCVSHLNKRVLIIEKEDRIGGCHAVKRVDGTFSEHGPRVYNSAFINFQQLLKEMGVSFYNIFAKYKFSVLDIGMIFSILTFEEQYILTINMLYLIFDDEYGSNILLKDFLIQNKFKKESYELIDRLCKLLDGGGVDKYTLHQFMQSINQNIFYQIYQPIVPNDKGLFKIWRDYLEAHNVTFLTDTKINNISIKNGLIHSLSLSSTNNIIKSDRFVFAIPPKHLSKVIEHHNIKHSWGDLQKFAQETAYIEYISVTFHWNKVLNLKHVYGFPKSEWGLIFLKLSDYMQFEEQESKTVVSCAVSIRDGKSSVIMKTANECNKDELLKEMFRQLQEAYGTLPEPTRTILYPEVKYELNEWISADTAFITTPHNGYLSFQNKQVKNMYSLGTHNGRSLYKYTTIESAVSNAIVLSKELYLELNNDKYIQLKRVITLTDIIYLVYIFIVLYLIYMIVKKST